MGMYDELTCEYPLPRPEMQTRTFQTKDLECGLWHYGITADGRLLCYPHRLERNPDWVEPSPDNKSITALFGMLVQVDEEPFQIDHHGDVYFYDFEKEHRTDPADYGPLITFRARFTEGRVTSIVEVPEQ